MYVEYGNLISFANTPTYNNMPEARLRGRIYNWIGEAKNDITKDYWFTVTYSFNQFGLAVDASIFVQVKNEIGQYERLGYYSPLGNVLLSEVIGIYNNEICNKCEPSDTPSQPLHYYVDGYYVEGYYV